MPDPSQSTLALLSLTQDITALVSLSIEATASLVHDWVQSAAATVGLASHHHPKAVVRSGVRGESGRGLAVVVIGASEATGQSLALHLAKSGYTVFPILPLPSPNSPPTSSALSNLLLAWSGMQKRIRTRNPSHPGAVVPVITDPDTPMEHWGGGIAGERAGKRRFRHAGETVRAYCRDHDLQLAAIVCAPRNFKSSLSISQLDATMSPVTTTNSWPVKAITYGNLDEAPFSHAPDPISLVMTDEKILVSLYRSNVVDPLLIIRELSDLLSESSATRRGRVIFVESGDPEDEDVQGRLGGVTKMIGAARMETTRLLRNDLVKVGIDVCEVLAGPMVSRLAGSNYLKLGSEDSATVDTDQEQEAQLSNAELEDPADPGIGGEMALTVSESKEAVLAHRLAFLSRIWAVDDALLYSAVRRAIEDRYPRHRHHAGISPILATLSEITPGSGVIRVLGRWLIGRLLSPRG